MSKVKHRKVSDKENQPLADYIPDLVSSVKKESTYIVSGIMSEIKNTFESNAKNSAKLFIESKTLNPPDTHRRYLYESKSSKEGFLAHPDSYKHPNHGEPMDLGSESSDDENQEQLSPQHFIKTDLSVEKPKVEYKLSQELSFNTLSDKVFKYANNCYLIVLSHQMSISQKNFSLHPKKKSR